MESNKRSFNGTMMYLQDPIRSFAWDANAYLTGTYTLSVYSNGVNVCVLTYIAEI